MVNYNSENDTLRYLKTIKESYKRTTHCSLDIIIVDNSTIKLSKLKDKISGLNLDVTVIDAENVGYFGAFKLALETIGYERVILYDHVIISNVDLELSSDFFGTLQTITPHSGVGVFAPSIFSKHRKTCLNPKILTKPSKYRVLFNYVMFKYPCLFKYYSRVSDIKIKLTQLSKDRKHIYAPHGSFMIFNRIFFLKGGVISYPVFLFGEEIYVAETVKSLNLKIEYIPSLKIYDWEHASTSKEKISFISQEHRKALKYILTNYYS